MSTAGARRHLSVEEYLDLDADTDELRYEYLGKRIWALAGTSPSHNLVKDNIRTEFHIHLRPRGRCSITSDQRVKNTVTRYVYPNVAVVCGPSEYTDEPPVVGPDYAIRSKA